MDKYQTKVAKIIFQGIQRYLTEIAYDCEKCKFRTEDDVKKCMIFGGSVIRFGKICRTEGCKMGFGKY